MAPTTWFMHPGWWRTSQIAGHRCMAKAIACKGTESEKQELDKDPWTRSPARINDGEKDAFAPIADIHKLYDQSKIEPDPMKRHALVWQMMKIHVAEGPFFSGTITNPPRIILVRKGLMNVPTREDLLKEGLGGFVNPWIIPSPAVYDPRRGSGMTPARTVASLSFV